MFSRMIDQKQLEFGQRRGTPPRTRELFAKSFDTRPRKVRANLNRGSGFVPTYIARVSFALNDVIS